MKKDVLGFLPENIENETIKSPAEIEKVEEAVTPMVRSSVDSDE